MVSAVALILAVLGVVAWVDARREGQALRSEVAQRLANTDAALTQAKTTQSDLANALRDAQAKLALLEARLAESQSQQAALETLYRELAPSRDELALTEVEQVLVLASQQLALAGNVQAALVALQLADGKLARMDRPQLAPLRRSLARDMDELKAVPFVDVSGISAKLDQAIAMIDSLPLAKDERLPPPQAEVPPANEPSWLRFLRDVWADAKSLVRIEVSDRPAAPLISPPQAYFLRENLRLRLLAARLALLARDDKSFRTDLNAAKAWVNRYFDTRVKPVQVISSNLTQLAATQMPAAMPDLSRSLESLRTLRIPREQAPERAPPRVK
ncbi:MAG TPA: uroporphyrinogen-III C-methyltransferase [Casimicrobiaceae bacterium]|jgi:uroporphyrin-3 C-methyltransferase